MLPVHILEGLAAFCIIFLSPGSMLAESEPACPVGWILFSSRCYFVVQTLYLWQEGRDACRDMGARIIEITSDEENQFIVDLIGAVTFTSKDKAWLDCTNVGRSLHDWVCGADDHELSYGNWKSTEPNNFAQENCLEIYSSGFWNDKECAQDLRLTICEKSLSAQSISKSILMKRDGSWPPRCLHNHVIDTIQSASLVECVSRCIAAGESCLSLNHFDGSRACQLNGADEVTASGDFLETKDCKYFRIVA